MGHHFKFSNGYYKCTECGTVARIVLENEHVEFVIPTNNGRPWEDPVADTINCEEEIIRNIIE